MKGNQNKYGIQDTFLEIYAVAGKTNVLSLLASILIFIFCLFREIDILFANAPLPPAFEWYLNFSPALWIATFCSCLYALAVPLLRIRKLPYGRRISNIAWSLFVVIFVILISTSLARIQILGSPKDYMQGVIAIIAVLVAVTGWFVNHQIAAFNSRVNHTLNLLLQTRVSNVFQEHANKVNLIYPSKVRSVISIDDVEEWLAFIPEIEDSKENLEKTRTLKEKKCEAIASQNYLLNYYEFLSVGIASGLLDEELLYQTIGGITVSQVNRSTNLIDRSRIDSPKTFEHLMQLYNRWSSRREYEIDKMKNLK